MGEQRQRKPAKSKTLLNDKRQAFVEHYLQCWNATEAARRAGYSEKTANQQGPRLLVNVGIQAAIQARIAELKMSTDEVLLRLAGHARGSIEAFLDDEDEFSLSQARANNQLHLVKKLKRTRRTEHPKDSDPVTTTTTEVELHDPQAALVHIGRALKLFGDRNEDVDLSKLSTNQLERLAKGESVYSVLANPG